MLKPKILVFVTILLIALVGLLAFGFMQKNPLLPTTEYYASDSNVAVYKQWLNPYRFFVKAKAQWYCFDTQKQMVYVPSSPTEYLGMHFYSHDMHSGVPITSGKIGHGSFAWSSDKIEFKYEPNPAIVIHKR